LTQRTPIAAKVFDDANFADVEFAEEHNPRIAAERFRVEITAMAAGHTVRVEAARVDERVLHLRTVRERVDQHIDPHV